MIIPTPEFDPLFADDGVAFRDKMSRYIEREFADLIGPATDLSRFLEARHLPIEVRFQRVDAGTRQGNAA